MNHKTNWKISWSLLFILITSVLTQIQTDSFEEQASEEISLQKKDFGISLLITGIASLASFLIGLFSKHDPPPNKPPKIHCPPSQTVWAARGAQTAKVWWQLPTASDPDGGHPAVTQISTPNLNSGAFFSEGTHTVKYEAKDSHSDTDTCSFSFTVNVHRCSADFTRLTHGRPTCSPATSGGKIPVWGTVCTYSCNLGYELLGPNRATCQESQRWTDAANHIINKAPTCPAVKCEHIPPVPHGEVKCASLDYPSSCPITCDPGYKVMGSDKITCGYDKQWTNPGVCKDVQAPSIQCVKYTEMYAGPKLAPVSVTWTMPDVTDNSGVVPKVTSDVQSGSYFTWGITNVTFTSSDADKNVGTCEMTVNIKVKRCPPLMKVNHSDIVCTNDNAYGSECKTTCDSGYELSGDRTLTCEENETWSGLQPSCPPIHCGPIPTVKNGSIVCNSTTYMSVCTLTCGQGYQIDGSDNITCQANRQWTSPGQCEDIQAPDLQCGPDIHTYAEPKLAPVKVTWTMPQSTDNSGVPPNVTSDIKSGSLFPPGLTTVMFMSTDDANNIAACNINVNVSVLQCQGLQIADHANMSCSHGTAYGSDCYTICDLGYDLKGDRIQTCEANQTWSGQPPHCEHMECSEPMFDTTGLMQFNCSYGRFLGENCYVSCSDGNPPGGTREITCTSKDYGTTGHVMYWTFAGSSPPYCAVGLCPELTPPKDGSLACKYVNGSGEFCVPSCNEKTMRPPSMPDVYECMERNTMWVPTDYVADCFGHRRLSLPVTEPEFHYFSNSCDPNSQEIKEDFLKAMSASIACALGCNVTEIHVTCSSNSSGRRDVSAKTVASYLVLISPRIVLDTPANQDWSADDLKKLYNNITATFNAELQKASAAGDFKIPSIGTFDKFTPGQLEVTCPHGTILDQRELTCPGCGEGHIYDSTTQTCVPCPVGTYQDQEIAFQCLQCPDGKTTTGSRSQSFKECQYLCIPGTFSKSGFEPCDDCQRGTYQSKSGMTSCDLCPFGMSTETGASTNATKCQFFNKEMTNITQGPWIQDFNVTMETFSIVTWLQPISNWPRMTLTFDLDKRFVPTGSAYLSLGMLKIFLIPRTSKEERPWYHLAAVYDNGKASLYVDGDLKAVVGGLSFTHMWRETISFVNSDHVDSVVLSGLEMTRKVLTKEDILSLSTSCEKHILHEHILAVDKLDKTLVTPSSCHQGTCTKLLWPKHGSLECEYVPQHGEFCRPRCEANTVRPSTMPDVYKCLDRTSTWEPMDYVQNCVAERHPQAAVMKQSFHYLNGSCNFDSQKLNNDFLKMLNTSLYNFTCGSIGCYGYDVRVVNVACSTSSTGAQAQSTYSQISAPYSIEVSLELSLGPFNDQGTPSDTDRYYKDVAANITSQIKDNSDNGSFTLSLAEVPSGLLEYRCEAGTLLDEELLRCAGCGEGYMYDNKTDTCKTCPMGTYQDKEIAFECMQCPDMKATSSVRAKTWQQCQYFCSPGTSSQSGIEPCELCPRGSYQSKSGMTSCDLCPYGMSTVAEASISDSACQFFNKEMTNSTLGPSIQLFDLTSETFSFVAWIQDTSALPRMTLNFDLYEPAMSNGSAYLSVGTLKVFIQPEEDLTSQEIRHWYHMAVVYNAGEAALYIDGSQIATMDNLSFSQMWRETISFVSSDDLNSVTVSGLQMTTAALTADKVSSFASSCDGHVDRNILLTDRLDVTLFTPSSCDDTNNCEADSCSGHGTCIDGLSHYTCLCEESWGGDTCEDMVVNATVALVSDIP